MKGRKQMERDQVPWPTRDDFCAWGLRPCEGPGCRKLVNPGAHVNRDRAPAAMCVNCRRKWLDGYWTRQREAGAAGGGGQALRERRARARAESTGGRGADRTLRSTDTDSPDEKGLYEFGRVTTSG